MIPHKVRGKHGIARLECLTCHANGGWTEELRKKYAPNTPSGAGQLHACNVISP